MFIKPNPQRLASGHLADERPKRRNLTVNTHADQSQVPEGVWQASDTPHGTATVLPIQPNEEAS